jgi:hypothetical protein
MKKLILISLILFLIIVPLPVSAIRTTFQDWTLGAWTSSYPPYVYINYTNMSSGEVLVYGKYAGQYLYNTVPTSADYIALDARNQTKIELFDSGMASMGSLTIPCGADNPLVYSRIEIKEVANVPKAYCNGTAYADYAFHATYPATIQISSPPMSGTPKMKVDNIVMGETDHHVVGALPTNQTIATGVITPGAVGVYALDPDTGALIQTNPTSFYLTADTDSLGGLGTESFIITNASGTTVNTTMLNSALPVHIVRYDLSVFLNEAKSIPGQYGAHFGGSTVYDYFTITSAGATVSLDKAWYTIGDVMTTTYSINASTYDPINNYYSVVIKNATAGSTISTTSIGTQSGTSQYTIQATDQQGGVYSEIVQTPKLPVGSQGAVLNYATATIQQYATFYGYVNDAQYQTVISGAVVTLTQGSTVYTGTTGADGSYTSAGTNFINGTPMIINTTKATYFTYNTSITPISLASAYLNISMNRTTPGYTGEAIGGIYRDGYLSNGMVYQGYGTPIGGGTILITNISTGESYTQTTNPFGWYLCDEGSSCVLTTKRPYNLVGSKFGYMSSTNYTPVAA